MARYPSSWPWFEQPAPRRRRVAHTSPLGWPYASAQPQRHMTVPTRRPVAPATPARRWMESSQSTPHPTRASEETPWRRRSPGASQQAPVEATAGRAVEQQAQEAPGSTSPGVSNTPEARGVHAPDTSPAPKPRVRDDVSGGEWSWKERFQRLQADFDNHRRRQRDEAEVAQQRARASVIKPWLEVLDSVGRALDTNSRDVDNPWRDGLVAIQRQMEQVLTREGVSAMISDGEPFDPHRFEAIATVPVENDDASGVVQHTTQTGYEFADGAVLRPAQVVVTAS